MELDHLNHLELIENLAAAAAAAFPWITADEQTGILATLLDFDSRFWNFSRYLSLPLYKETLLLLNSGMAANWLPERPRLAVVIPVYRADRDLLHLALQSLQDQVGVDLEVLISVDGRDQDGQLVVDVLSQLETETAATAIGSLQVFQASSNVGVGLCRNRALQNVASPWFTCLDADDIFHPLRCLHALLLLRQLGIERLNTGWSRVSLGQRKIILINGLMTSHGHNSFVACTSLLQRYGYFANLRVHEDTEYQQRLHFFQVPMQTTPVVGHYMNSEVIPGYQSLSTPLRKTVHPIENHPYLCGSVIAEADDERLGIQQHYQQHYRDLFASALLAAFPPS
ncbi:MAG: glycosyltransferase family 2 protein [Synechococcaceae cyanobacterium]